MSTKLELDFPMLKTLQRKLEEVDGALDSAVTTVLEDSNALIAQQLEAAMSKHRRTGKTQSTILKNTDVLKANTGFKISEGGLPSIFLMYGTTVHGQPHIQPDRELYNAIYGAATRKKIQEIQANAFFKTIDEVMNK